MPETSGESTPRVLDFRGRVIGKGAHIVYVVRNGSRTSFREGWVIQDIVAGKDIYDRPVLEIKVEVIREQGINVALRPSPRLTTLTQPDNIVVIEEAWERK